MPKITEMYAFITHEEGREDDEGIIGASPDGRTWMPLVGADMTRVKDLIPFAEETKRRTGIPYRIVKFKIDGEIKNAVAKELCQ